MSSNYKKQTLIEYLQEARKFLESERVEGYENYIKAISSENVLLNQAETVLFIVDLKLDKIVYVSSNSDIVEGYTQQELMRISATKYFEMIHPKDAEIVINKVFVDGMTFTNNHPEISYDRFRVSYNYRFLQKDGSYKKLMQQFSYMMVDENKNPLMLMGTIIDISEIYLQPNIFCKITQLSNKGKWIKVFEHFYPIVDTLSDYRISEKEMEIISFVSLGLSSKEIANITHRSVETINSQRKSILSKTGCKSMTEVIVLAKEQGWI